MQGHHEPLAFSPQLKGSSCRTTLLLLLLLLPSKERTLVFRVRSSIVFVFAHKIGSSKERRRKRRRRRRRRRSWSSFSRLSGGLSVEWCRSIRRSLHHKPDFLKDTASATVKSLCLAFCKRSPLEMKKANVDGDQFEERGRGAKRSSGFVWHHSL
jgi:hypothetical protein